MTYTKQVRMLLFLFLFLASISNN